jgi:hypothetical protein
MIDVEFPTIQHGMEGLGTLIDYLTKYGYCKVSHDTHQACALFGQIQRWNRRRAQGGSDWLGE